MINSRDPTLPSANQFTCRGSGVCAQGHSRFKVRTLSWSPLDSSSVSLTEPPQYRHLRRLSSRSLQHFAARGNYGDTCETIGTVVSELYHATWDNRDERLRRTGAAPALRVYRGLKACISPGRPGWFMAGWYGVRELDM